MRKHREKAPRPWSGGGKWAAHTLLCSQSLALTSTDKLKRHSLCQVVCICERDNERSDLCCKRTLTGGRKYRKGQSGLGGRVSCSRRRWLLDEGGGSDTEPLDAREVKYAGLGGGGGLGIAGWKHLKDSQVFGSCSRVVAVRVVAVGFLAHVHEWSPFTEMSTGGKPLLFTWFTYKQ